MLIVSSVIVSLGAVGFVRFLTVILTARRAVFICGETEVIVPETMVPVEMNISGQSSKTMRGQAAVSYRGRCDDVGNPCAVVPKFERRRACVPFFSSIVTDSFAHFIRNL